MSYDKRQDQLNRSSPAADHAKLGDVCADLIQNYNTLLASYVALAAKYESLLGHLDAANVAGIGNGNTAAYGETATTAVAIKTLDQR
jgi:hypothetical protein